VKNLTLALALALTASSAVAEPGVIVMGDSISAVSNSWSNVIANQGVNVQNIAMAGRKLRDFSIPRDLHADGQFDTVVYFLGINDAQAYLDPADVAEVFEAHMVFLIARGFDILVLYPNRVPIIPELDLSIRKVKQAMNKVCVKHDIDCRTIPVWRSYLTHDTVHPKPELHRDIAFWVIDVLDL